jgi:hypothetical protein
MKRTALGSSILACWRRAPRNQVFGHRTDTNSTDEPLFSTVEVKSPNRSDKYPEGRSSPNMPTNKSPPANVPTPRLP